MPPAVGYAIAGIAGLVGTTAAAKTQQRSQREASRLEDDALRRAEADAREERDYSRRFQEDERGYSRGQYANYLTRLEPYAASGQRATGRLEGILSSGLPASVPTSGSGSLVTMKAPTGQTRQVPVDQVPWYEAKGATRVEGVH